MPEHNKHTAARFARLFALTGWSAFELARRLNCNDKTVRNMLAAKREIAPEIMAWLGDLAAFHHDNPAPDFQQLRQR